MPAGPRSCVVVSKIAGGSAHLLWQDRETFTIPWGYGWVPEPHGAVGWFRSLRTTRKCPLISAGFALVARRYCWSEKPSDRQGPSRFVEWSLLLTGGHRTHGGDCPTPGCWQKGDKGPDLPGNTRGFLTLPLWITDDGTLGASCSRDRSHGQTGAPGPMAASDRMRGYRGRDDSPEGTEPLPQGVVRGSLPAVDPAGPGIPDAHRVRGPVRGRRGGRRHPGGRTRCG